MVSVTLTDGRPSVVLSLWEAVLLCDAADRMGSAGAPGVEDLAEALHGAVVEAGHRPCRCGRVHPTGVRCRGRRRRPKSPWWRRILAKRAST